MALGPAEGGPFRDGGPRGFTGILERHVRGTTPLRLRSMNEQSACHEVSNLILNQRKSCT